MRVVICGAGVAGVALGCHLVERGHDVDLVELAPELRGGGFMIDFFGPGYDTAERMGLLEQLAEIHQPIENLIFVDSSGRERLRVPCQDVRAAFRGRHFNFPRGDLVSVLNAEDAGCPRYRFQRHRERLGNRGESRRGLIRHGCVNLSRSDGLAIDLFRPPRRGDTRSTEAHILQQ